jgi:hypothetical protein
MSIYSVPFHADKLRSSSRPVVAYLPCFPAVVAPGSAAAKPTGIFHKLQHRIKSVTLMGALLFAFLGILETGVTTYTL